MKITTFILTCTIFILGIALIALAHHTKNYEVLRFEVHHSEDEFFGSLGLPYQQTTFNHKAEGVEVIRTIQSGAREQRQRHSQDIRREERVDDCIVEITKNWIRELGNELIIGYNEDEDFKLRWRLENRAVNGEPVCRKKVHS